MENVLYGLAAGLVVALLVFIFMAIRLRSQKSASEKENARLKQMLTDRMELESEGLNKLIPLAERIYAECGTRVSTGLLNRAMEETLTRHQAPVVRRVRPKFFYLTQAESEPPTFVFFVSDAERVSPTYARYLESSLRKTFQIRYAPMRVKLRSSHKKEK